MKMKNTSHRHDVNTPRSRDILSIRIISVLLYFYV